MSYDISIYVRADLPDAEADYRGTICSMNWLRNPFGLCSFAEDNVGAGDQALWHVCNDHAYDKANEIDRPKFLEVVRTYHDKISALEQAFFHFRFESYLQLAPDHPQAMVVRWNDKDVQWAKDEHGPILKLDVMRFADERDFGWARLPGVTPLLYYKAWIADLLDLAKAMQAPNTIVHISN